MRLSPPLAAYSHSSAVGNRPPIQLQNRIACWKSMQLIGWSLRSVPQLQRRPAAATLQVRASTQRWYADSVTSVFPSENAGTLKPSFAGFSLSSQAVSRGSQPTRKVPAGSWTNSRPDLGSFQVLPTLSGSSSSERLTYAVWPRTTVAVASAGLNPGASARTRCGPRNASTCREASTGAPSTLTCAKIAAEGGFTDTARELVSLRSAGGSASVIALNAPCPSVLRSTTSGVPSPSRSATSSGGLHGAMPAGPSS